VLVVPSALAEVSLIVWLLVKGLNNLRRADHLPASAEPASAPG
jgi:hypothetical protein